MDFSLWQIYGSNQPIGEDKVNLSVLNPSIAEANPSYEFGNPCGWANEVGIQVSNYYHSYPNAPPQFVNTIQFIDVPKFNGAGDFKVWVNQYCWVLGFQNMEDEQKIRRVSRYLEGAAIRWHNAYMAGKIEYPSWSDYVFGMNCWFDLRQTDLLMVEWIYLTQKGTLLEYYDYFSRTRVRVLCSEEFAVEYFIGGLREEYQDFVRGKLPSTVYEAYCWAYNYEGFLLSLENLDNLIKSTLASTAQKSNIESSQETISRTSELELGLNGVDEEFQKVEENDCELNFENDQKEVQASESSIEFQPLVEVCNQVVDVAYPIEAISSKEDEEVHGELISDLGDLNHGCVDVLPQEHDSMVSQMELVPSIRNDGLNHGNSSLDVGDFMESEMGAKKVVGSNSVTCQMELVSSTLGDGLMVEKLSRQEDLEHEPGLEKKEEEVEEKKENGNDLSVSKISVDIEHLNLVDKEHEVVVENDQLEGQVLEAMIEVGYKVSDIENRFDVPMEFQSMVLKIDFLGVEIRTEMLQLEVGKKCVMKYVKLEAVFGDRLETIRRNCGDAGFDKFGDIGVHFSYKMLVMGCGQVAKDDIQWDYKRYKKKVQKGGLHKFPSCLLLEA